MAYYIKTVTDFAAAHSLRGYDGACQRLHGHNWKIEVEAKSDTLNEIGIVIDFKLLKSHVKTIIDKLDHYYLNDIAPFDKINPTAENIAKYFYDELDLLLTESVKINSVVIWETDRACARYEAE